MPTQPPDTGRGTDSSETIRDQFERGVRDFSLLFTRWMDTNGERPAIPVELRGDALHFSAEGAAHDHPGVDLSDLAGLIAHAPTRMG